MRFPIVLCLCTATVFLTGCKTKYYYVDSGVPVGHACPTGDECYGGSFCVEGKCTIRCETTADCAGFEGTECRPYGETNDLTCVTVRYIKGEVTVGTPCGVDPAACDPVDPQCDPAFECGQSCASDEECSPSYRCATEFNQCVRKLFCYSRRTDDPDSFCTQECVDDRDCPPRLYCEFVASETDRNRKMCVPRVFCAPCEFDSDCQLPDGVCAPDQWGVKFCTTACVPPVDPATVPALPGMCTQDPDHILFDECRAADARFRCLYSGYSPMTGWKTGTCVDPNVSMCPQPYSECKDAGDGRNLCYHRYGSCTGDGSACAPCRSRKDCDEAGGALCYRSSKSLERFCTATCSTTCADSSYACFELSNSCTTNLSCYAPDGTCDTASETCTPGNPPQCFKDFDWGCQLVASKPYSNPRYPTCYPEIAGAACFSVPP
jgi:hypothetical protein